MIVKLQKAILDDAQKIHELQIQAFAPLLAKYEDYEISPGAEKIDRIIERLKQEFTDYYLIGYEGIIVGAIRIIRMKENRKCRISPIFIKTEYQNKGIAQKVFKIVEEMYSQITTWNLDTILEEAGNCYLYEKLGYKKLDKIEKINEKMHILFYEKRI
jgi:N-acetylglutamate synthase-like GNAT family acetyltransferase